MWDLVWLPSFIPMELALLSDNHTRKRNQGSPVGLLRNLLTSSNAKAHSCTRAGQAQMLIQTAAQGMSVATACHRAKKKWQEAGPEDALEDQLLEGLSVPGASSGICFHHSQGCAQWGRLRLVTLFQKKKKKKQ